MQLAIAISSTRYCCLSRRKYSVFEACKKECLFYRDHGKKFRRKHLEDRKKVEHDNNDEEALANICKIIQHEHQQDFW